MTVQQWEHETPCSIAECTRCKTWRAAMRAKEQVFAAQDAAGSMPNGPLKTKTRTMLLRTRLLLEAVDNLFVDDDMRANEAQRGTK